MEKIKGTTDVWLAGDFYGPDDIKRDGPKCVSRLNYTSNDMASSGWVKIGTAEITLSLISDEKMVANKVESLKAEIHEIRATSENAITRLQAKIQSLLAITA